MIFGPKGSSDLITQEHEIGLHGVEAADVRIGLSVGELHLHGGARGLMNGAFTYPEELEPEIAYYVSSGTGRLKVNHMQPRHVRSFDGMSWDIALNDDLPIDLQVGMATGESRLDLSTLNLTSFELGRATGSTGVDLSGDHALLTRVDVDSATGDFSLNLSGGYASLSTLKAKTATGDLMLDLSGTWGRDLDGKITVATGSVHVRLPGDVGVEVRTKAAVSKVSAPGFIQDGHVYRNHAFGSSPVTLRLALSAAVGTFILDTVE